MDLQFLVISARIQKLAEFRCANQIVYALPDITVRLDVE